MYYIYKGFLHFASDITENCNVDYHKAIELTESEAISITLDSALKSRGREQTLKVCPHCILNKKDI